MFKLLCMMMTLIYVSGEETYEPFVLANKSISRILHGWKGSPGDVPYQVSFRIKVFVNNKPYKYRYNNICGGSIVAANKVLSAAHCFVKDPNFCHTLLNLQPPVRMSLRRVYAVAGTMSNTGDPDRDYESNGQWRTIKEVKYPVNYKFPHFDICVVVTRRRFTFNEYVNYIPYASKDMDYSGTCLVSGFGSTNRHRNLPSPHLLLGNATMLPMNRCDEMGASGRKFICTAPPSGPLKGDSGGPLVCYNTSDTRENGSRGLLVGVTCAGFQIPPYYFMYTRVSFHKSLIDEYVNTSCLLQGYIYCVLINIALLF